MKRFFILIMCIMIPKTIFAINVEGFAFLNNQSIHDSIEVHFEMQAPGSNMYTIYTDVNGYYFENIENGIYNVKFTKNGYYQRLLSLIVLYNNTTLDTTILYKNIVFVPSAYDNIQDAINICNYGDTVLVEEGIYYENINFNGKNITLASLYIMNNDDYYIENTIIDGNNFESVVVFENEEDSSSVINGFTVMNGYGQGSNQQYYGGGISCKNSSPKIINMLVKENESNMYGGGISLINSRAILENIKIFNNFTNGYGGGISSICQGPKLKNITIKNNQADEYGGGIYSDDSILNLENVSIVNNYAHKGGGLYCISFDSNFNPIFSMDNKSSIYSNYIINNKGLGKEIYSEIYDTAFTVILDTFTILTPTDYYATPIEKYLFSIDNAIEDSLINKDVYVSVCGSNSNIGTSADEPFKTIKYALSRIYSDSTNINTIHLEPGIYSDSTNREEYPLEWSSYVNLKGDNVSNTILDARNNSRVLSLFDVKNTKIENISIINGSDMMGGGISCIVSDVNLNNVIIKDNISSGDGGGMYVSISNINLKNVEIYNNEGNNGGGVYCSYTTFCNENLIIRNNQAEFGGGIYCKKIILEENENVKIFNNFATNGGGIYNDSEYYQNSIFKNLEISNNNASTHGGGIFCHLEEASCLLGNLTITNNSAGYNGGGIYNFGWDSNLEIQNSIIADNIGNYGIYVISFSGEINIIYSNFYNNEMGNFYDCGQWVGFNVTTNVNGDSCDVYYNIQESPLFVDPLNGDYRLSWTNYPIPDETMSPCIDAGDPNSTPDPDGTIADMGAYYFNQNVSIDCPGQSPEYNLMCYPNPISSRVNNLTLSFSINKPGKVTIQLFNIKGQLISTLINEEINTGDHSISFSISDLSSGIYFTKMSVDGVDKEIRKFVLLR